MKAKRVHYFPSTTTAYNMCQCSMFIQDGDILSIPSEGVIGIADTWPFAVTRHRGSLHGVSNWGDPFFMGPMKESVEQARALAVSLNYPLPWSKKK